MHHYVLCTQLQLNKYNILRSFIWYQSIGFTIPKDSIYLVKTPTSLISGRKFGYHLHSQYNSRSKSPLFNVIAKTTTLFGIN